MDVSHPGLSYSPYLNVENEEMSKPQLLEVILIKVADRAPLRSLRQSGITAV